MEEYAVRIYGPKWPLIILLVATLILSVIGAVTVTNWIF